MAIFRKIHTSFWEDSFISELDPKAKLFYLYLLTNPRTKQCGIYEITIKQIAFDLGYSIDTVLKYIKDFNSFGKIMYNTETSELAIKNWGKYNDNPSPKVQNLIDKEIADVKDRVLIEYLYSTDTVPIHNRQTKQNKEEEEQEIEQEKDSKKAIIEKEVFEEFRKIYPGKKRGLDTEFGNFIKKHKDHGKVVELLKPAIEVEMKDRAAAMRSKRFYPEPANLQTWINQRRWEQAEAIIAGAGEVTAMPEKKLPVNDAGYRDFRYLDPNELQ